MKMEEVNLDQKSIGETNSVNSSSHSNIDLNDSEDSLFFADATLEDAHHMVDSPVGRSATAPIRSSLFDLEEDPPLTGNTIRTNGRNHDLVKDENNNSYGLDNTGTIVHTSETVLQRRKRPPIPRDIAWAAYATTFIPMSLLVPFWICHRHPETYTTPPHDAVASHVGDVIYGWNFAASSNRGHVATLVSAILAYGAATVLSILLYRNPASGDLGEDARHAAASQLTLLSHYVALGVIYPSLLALIYTEFPKATSANLWALILLLCFLRDLVTLRGILMCHAPFLIQDRGQGRRMFFRTLTCASLDILSRSLRRLSFYRIVSAALLLQLFLVIIWRSALFVALSIPLDTGVTTTRTLLIVAAILGGKWATSIVARMLGLIASGGVTAWFAQQQHVLLQQTRAVGSNGGLPTTNNLLEMTNISKLESKDALAAEEDEEEGGENSLASTGSTSNKMPEAYRTVDPNAYRSVNDFDDANMYYDDEDDLYNEEFTEISDHIIHPFSSPQRSVDNNSHHRGGNIDTLGTATTAKEFLLQALTISFGSVAQCALLGGLAQFVWSCLRNARVAQTAASRHGRRRREDNNFQGMDVRTADQSNRQQAILNVAQQSVVSCQDLSRKFVTSHTDLGMAHVATYFKSYSKAALDVSNLVHSSGKNKWRESEREKECSQLYTSLLNFPSNAKFFSLVLFFLIFK